MSVKRFSTFFWYVHKSSLIGLYRRFSNKYDVFGFMYKYIDLRCENVVM